MKKKIMVLTGSPRKDGNSSALASAFIKGAQEGDNEVIRYNIADQEIKPCIACDTCFSKGKACTLDNNYSEFAEIVKDVDALVIATPLYWFTFPAQIKAVIDKFYSFALSERPLAIKETMLLVCGELDKKEVFDAIVESHSQIAKFHSWENRGSLLVPSVLDKGDIEKTSALTEAEKLGFEF